MGKNDVSKNGSKLKTVSSHAKKRTVIQDKAHVKQAMDRINNSFEIMKQIQEKLHRAYVEIHSEVKDI